MLTPLHSLVEDDLGHRLVANLIAIGVVVQAGWTARLLFPDGLGLASFLLLVGAELAVPLWAERSRRTTWHPEHVAERYGLFTIIVLGESVLLRRATPSAKTLPTAA